MSASTKDSGTRHPYNGRHGSEGPIGLLRKGNLQGYAEQFPAARSPFTIEAGKEGSDAFLLPRAARNTFYAVHVFDVGYALRRDDAAYCCET